MKVISVTLSCLLLAAKAYGQTIIAELYQDLRNPDPKVRDAANRNSAQLLTKEFSQIERETKIICDGLTDTDTTIRQDSSAILNVIVQIHTDKSSVVSACLPQLLTTAVDPVDQIRMNSLNALALKNGGPPQAAAPLFNAALNDKNTAVRQIAATGILKLPAETNQESVKLLADRITAEQAPEVKQALLLGAVQSLKTNPEIALAASRLIADVSPDVKAAAILAVENLNSDKARAQTELQNYQNSPLLSRDDKARLEEAITRLQTATH